MHGEVGRWDPVLHARFLALREGRKREKLRAREQRLFAELLRTNTPLLAVLVDQVSGRGKTQEGKNLHNRMRVYGAERLPRSDVWGAAYIAFFKAMDDFNPSKGALSMFLKRKIFYEVQCLMMKSGAVTLPRELAGHRTETYAEDDEHFARLTAFEEALDDSPEPETVALPPLHPEPPPPPPPDTRPALVVLMEDHLSFAKGGRCAATPLRGRYEQVAFARGEIARTSDLLQALRERDVRPTKARVPWAPSPVEAFAGVLLQSIARPPTLQSARAQTTPSDSARTG